MRLSGGRGGVGEWRTRRSGGDKGETRLVRNLEGRGCALYMSPDVLCALGEMRGVVDFRALEEGPARPSITSTGRTRYRSRPQTQRGAPEQVVTEAPWKNWGRRSR